jgi:hypothetical protein
MPTTGADGTITSVAVMKELRELCDAHDLALHVDGARHRPRRRPRAEHSAASLIARISGDAIGQIWDVADDLSGSADRQTPRPPARGCTTGL